MLVIIERVDCFTHVNDAHYNLGHPCEEILMKKAQDSNCEPISKLASCKGCTGSEGKQKNISRTRNVCFVFVILVWPLNWHTLHS